MPTSLLQNGSFEQGPDPGAFLPLNPNSTAIPGWTVIRGGIDYYGAEWASADGKRSLDLNGTPGVGGIAQTFATTPGQTYQVSFDLAGHPSGLLQTMAVSAAGQSKDFTFQSGTDPNHLGWQKDTWSFKANSPQTTLEFYSKQTGYPFGGPALDNVVVTTDTATQPSDGTTPQTPVDTTPQTPVDTTPKQLPPIPKNPPGPAQESPAGSHPAGNHPPVVTAQQNGAAIQQPRSISDLVSATDVDGDTIGYWALWDDNPAGGHIFLQSPSTGWFSDGAQWLNMTPGYLPPARHPVLVSASEMSHLLFQPAIPASPGASETDTLYAAAWDGAEWSQWASFPIFSGSIATVGGPAPPH